MVDDRKLQPARDALEEAAGAWADDLPGVYYLEEALDYTENEDMDEEEEEGAWLDVKAALSAAARDRNKAVKRFESITVKWAAYLKKLDAQLASVRKMVR